jgi:putative transposase
MRKARFTEEQIIGILKEHDAGAKAEELCRRHGISGTTFYKWKAKFAGWRPPTPSGCVRWRMRTGVLKKLLAEQMLDNAALKDLVGKNFSDASCGSSPCVEHHGLSQRRATRLLDVDRSAVRYRHKRKDDAADRELLHALAAERRQFGYRRLREMPRRKGNVMNRKKVYRLYREEGLMVRRRRGRKRALGTQAPLKSARRPNEVWVLDFVADVLESGRRFRVFNVEDQFTRTGLATEVDTSLPSAIASSPSTAGRR